MFSKLEEFVKKMYGSKLLNQVEIQRIIVKAVELQLISTPNLQIVEPISSEKLLDIIKKISTHNYNEKNTLPPMDDNSNIEFQKLEKVINAFIQYEKKRIEPKTMSFKLIFIIMICILGIPLILYLNYTPIPY